MREAGLKPQPKDPLRYFRIEAREISQELGKGVLKLEKEITPELVAHLLRLAHTLKGAASVVKQQDIAQLAHNLEDLLTPYRQRKAVFPQAKTDDILAQVDAISAEVSALAPAMAAAASAPLLPAQASAPMELDSLLREISDAGAHLQGLRHAAANAPANLARALSEGLDHAERGIALAHGLAEGLRLISCGILFTALERAVRDAGHALGLDVAFSGEGGDIRLDAQILGAVQPALVQLVRNAVVHGIEKPEQRAPKPSQGLVEVIVARRGGRVAFTVRDDGRGIDLAAVEGVARARGFAPQGREELIGLVLKGGLTTANQVSELSGRGIGIDIVRETAEQLGGEVTAQSETGRGTSITLAVPLSLSSLDALLVAVGDKVAAIPLSAVAASFRLEMDLSPRGGTILKDGQSMAFASAADVLGWTQTEEAEARSAVIVQSGDERAAIAIDRLLGVENIVVRPAPPLAFAEPLVSALFLDAAGTPRMVLEPKALLAAAERPAAKTLPKTPAKAPTQRSTKAQPILVIDDSLTTRVLEQSILESAGYEVELAASAEEGLEKARRRRYALFLVDVEMPGMDGFTFVETTRADAELKSVPAILVTSRNAPADRARGQEAGAHAYIVKSEFNQDIVLGIIRRLLA